MELRSTVTMKGKHFDQNIQICPYVEMLVTKLSRKDEPLPTHTS